jgi:shikimate kinase
MASGKTTIGKRLSKKLSLNFIDLDDYIIEKEKMSISDVFKNKGEVYFRLIENKYLKEILSENDNFLLSLGGGTPCYANNMEEINKENTISIYLEGGTATMIERLIRKKAKRPLIASLGDDKIPEFVAKHLFERRPFYELAKMKVKIDKKTKKNVAKEIVKLLN